jgi:hypothetical protein
MTIIHITYVFLIRIIFSLYYSRLISPPRYWVSCWSSRLNCSFSASNFTSHSMLSGLFSWRKSLGNVRINTPSYRFMLLLLQWLYSPNRALASSILMRFRNNLAPRPTPNLEGKGIPFCLGHHLEPVWHWRPTSSYATASIALRIIWPTQASPLCQSRDIFWGACRFIQ